MNRDSHELGYGELLRSLFHAGYTRVERDDRLLDVFPAEDREKGVELWERWGAGDVRILRVRLPFDADKLQLFAISRRELETYLQRNEIRDLSDEKLLAKGEGAAANL